MKSLNGYFENVHITLYMFYTPEHTHECLTFTNNNLISHQGNLITSSISNYIKHTQPIYHFIFKMFCTRSWNIFGPLFMTKKPWKIFQGGLLGQGGIQIFRINHNKPLISLWQSFFDVFSLCCILFSHCLIFFTWLSEGL